MADPAVAALIWRLRRQGLSYRRIAAHLNRKRVPPARATTWAAMTVRNIAHAEARKRQEPVPG